MSWTARIKNDTGVKDLGTVTAQWRVFDDKGILLESYDYTKERVDRKGGLDAFVKEAKDGLAAYQGAKSERDAVEADIVTRLSA